MVHLTLRLHSSLSCAHSACLLSLSLFEYTCLNTPACSQSASLSATPLRVSGTRVIASHQKRPLDGAAVVRSAIAVGLETARAILNATQPPASTMVVIASAAMWVRRPSASRASVGNGTPCVLASAVTEHVMRVSNVTMGTLRMVMAAPAHARSKPIRSAASRWWGDPPVPSCRRRRHRQRCLPFRLPPRPSCPRRRQSILPCYLESLWWRRTL